MHSQGDVTWDESGWWPLRQFGVLQDITDVRRTEYELRASGARFTLVDHATDAFFLIDEQLPVLDLAVGGGSRRSIFLRRRRAAERAPWPPRPSDCKTTAQAAHCPQGITLQIELLGSLSP
jgi:PAS domain-containing protein